VQELTHDELELGRRAEKNAEKEVVIAGLE
jgi:hypothetical protein